MLLKVASSQRLHQQLQQRACTLQAAAAASVPSRQRLLLHQRVAMAAAAAASMMQSSLEQAVQAWAASTAAEKGEQYFQLLKGQPLLLPAAASPSALLHVQNICLCA
jgi:ferric-dicitrate binding protein FerR (iron transport regulator)